MVFVVVVVVVLVLVLVGWKRRLGECVAGLESEVASCGLVVGGRSISEAKMEWLTDPVIV
jgi:hypothetical protein